MAHSRVPGWRAGWWVLLALTLLPFAAIAAVLPAAPLTLRWEIERQPEGADGSSAATLTLENHGAAALGDSGWALYFTCLAGVRSGPVGDHLWIDGLGGTYFRLRPEPGFPGLAPGGALRVPVRHFDVVIGDSLAPTGAFLVTEAAPDQGRPLASLEIAPRTRPEQFPRLADGRRAPSAEEAYRENADVADLPLESLPPVLPTPQHVARAVGELVLRGRPAIRASARLADARARAAELLDRAFGRGPVAAEAPPLVLEIAPGSARSPEAYTLYLDPAAGVRIRGASVAGVLRGLASLDWLLPAAPTSDGVVRLPLWSIEDAPRFAYRGQALDVARNFERPEVVARMIDLMARLKLNTLHLHLTDDEGWRLEIDGLPELTEVGGRRGFGTDARRQLPPAHGSGPDLADPFGSGYFRRAEFVALLRYAHARGITVVPEIEMPGHARAAIVAMDARAARLRAAGDTAGANRYLLRDPQDRSQYLSAQGHTDNAIDPGLESSYAFLERVFDALAADYREAGVPLRTLHVGGDELPNGVWERSPACAARVRREHLRSTADLWAYFYRRVNASLARRGIAMAGWEQLGLRRGPVGARAEPAPAFAGRGTSVYVWDNLAGAEDRGYRLANAGYRTVLAPVSNVYFDIAYEDRAEEPGHNWAPSIPLRTVFDFVPLDDIRRSPLEPGAVPGRVALTAAGRGHVAGLEGELFSETIRGTERLDYLLMPRLVALAERAWAADPAWARAASSADAARLHATAWSTFMNQVAKQVLPRFDAGPSAIRYRIPPPGLRVEAGRVYANHAYPGFRLRYTTDGSEPGSASPEVRAPIEAHGRITVAAFATDGRSGRGAHVDVP